MRERTWHWMSFAIVQIRPVATRSRRAVWSRCREVWQNIKAADVAAGRRQTKAALYDVMGAAMHIWRTAVAVARASRAFARPPVCLFGSTQE
jgi:hypothetical protein